MLSTYTRDDAQRWLRRARAMAAELVAAEADVIKVMAAELAERHRLTGSQLLSLYYVGRIL
jgi:phage terminase Nu1 subunit (DNA packaging protein)